MKPSPHGADEKERFGFQPTYEELKQKDFDVALCPLEGFQPTYEELKLLSGAQKLLDLGGFQPTYEELKRQRLKELRDELGMFSAYL